MADPSSLLSQALEVQVLPDRGAKLTALKDRRTGRDWLLKSQRPQGDYPAAAIGGDFSAFDTSGLDECFPCVAAGPHPDGSVHWPDHGELWSRAWDARALPDGGLVTSIEGHAWDYAFERTARLAGESLRLDYAVTNRGPRPLAHLYSQHALLAAEEGMTVALPGVREVFVNWASDPALGRFGDRRAWSDLGLSQVKRSGVAVKLFAKPDEGRAALVAPDGARLTFTWSLAELPYLGVWLCYGGWPTDGRPGHLTVALEPCSGMPDALDEAALRGTCPVLLPGERRTWSVTLTSTLP